MIWRDDDIGVKTDLAVFAAVDDLFQRYGLRHTVAIMAFGLHQRPDLVAFLRHRDVACELHCWTHLDLPQSTEGRDDLARAVTQIETLIGRRPTVLYPPWNRTSPEVEAAAASLGLTVSAQKISLAQFLRCGGSDRDVINFHYWEPSDVALLEPAMQAYHASRRMKPTDYAPRAAFMDTLLTWHNIGVEVGVDAGAHAEALLRYCALEKLYLVDRWEKEYPLGICTGRVWALGFKPIVEFIHKGSIEAAKQFQNGTLHFVYVDQHHEKSIVEADLQAWWPKLLPGGLLGYRNYAPSNQGLSEAIDVFIAAGSITAYKYAGEIVLVKP